jgi:enoyl reductase-like protein
VRIRNFYDSDFNLNFKKDSLWQFSNAFAVVEVTAA